MNRTRQVPEWQQSLTILTASVVTVVVIAGLYWAQTVLIPFALGIFLSFLLNPLVRKLNKWGLGRVPSVLVVVTFAAAVLFGALYLVTTQISGLLLELPQYANNIKARVEALRGMGQGTAASGLDQLWKSISGVFGGGTQPGTNQVVTQTPTPSATVTLPQPEHVVVQQQSDWVSRLPWLLGGVLGPLATFGLAAVLAIFMLLKREDLRSRFIRLVGQGQITTTTKGMDDAGARISRYLLMQLVINSIYGLVWGIGLALIGVHHALLWGFLAALLRYVPYLGAPLAAVFPVLLSLAQFPGWVQPVLVVGLITVMEAITGNAIEPMVFGKSIGVSEVALLVAAAVWAFLWGPIGLVLSGPLTVCLVVLGWHVPQLEFLGILLGDEPVLEPEVNLYQRLLARDQDEAVQVVRERLAKPDPGKMYDDLLIPVLNQVRKDRERDSVEEKDEQFVLRTTREILEDLGEHPGNGQNPSAQEPTKAGEPRQVTRLLGLPSRDEADVIALEMLRQALGSARWEIEVASAQMLSSELVDLAAGREPAVICVASLPPGGLIHTRYLCKRLRSRLPKVRIVIGRWGLQTNLEQNQRELQEAGADQVSTTLQETVRTLEAWLPVLDHKPERTEKAGAERRTEDPTPAKALAGPNGR